MSISDYVLRHLAVYRCISQLGKNSSCLTPHSPLGKNYHRGLPHPLAKFIVEDPKIQD